MCDLLNDGPKIPKDSLPLALGDHIRIQNQIGPHPTKWDKTGRVAEICQFDLYVIGVDGSGRLTICNKKFLCKFIPVHPPPSHTPSQTTSDTKQFLNIKASQLHHIPHQGNWPNPFTIYTNTTTLTKVPTTQDSATESNTHKTTPCSP